MGDPSYKVRIKYKPSPVDYDEDLIRAYARVSRMRVKLRRYLGLDFLSTGATTGTHPRGHLLEQLRCVIYANVDWNMLSFMFYPDSSFMKGGFCSEKAFDYIKPSSIIYKREIREPRALFRLYPGSNCLSFPFDKHDHDYNSLSIGGRAKFIVPFIVVTFSALEGNSGERSRQLVLHLHLLGDRGWLLLASLIRLFCLFVLPGEFTDGFVVRPVLLLAIFGTVSMILLLVLQQIHKQLNLYGM